MEKPSTESSVIEGEVVESSSAIVPSAPRERASVILAPVMNLELAKKRLAEFQEFVAYYLVEGEDFGTIPGTPKPTLYKPGADKLCELYGLYDDYVITSKVEDFTADPPLFDYTVKCTLRSRRDDSIVSAGFGSCNSYEGKYKWREMKRKCPNCGKETVIKGKAEWGGGWLCWNKPGKSDGCGAKWSDGDPAIEKQEVGKVFNDDIATLKNTILKMAMKRAKIGPTLAATRSSGIFTQDMEDITAGAEETGSKSAAEAVAKGKIADYEKRAATSVHEKLVQFKPVQMGDIACLQFIASPALALLLEHGAADFTIYSDTLTARYMPDDASYLKKLSELATPLGVRTERIEDYSKPVTAKAPPVAQPAAPVNPTFVIGASKEVTARGKTFLAVNWGNEEYSVWDTALWPYIKQGEGQMGMFDFTTKQVGSKTYKNITGIKRIGNQEFDDLGPVLQNQSR